MRLSNILDSKGHAVVTIQPDARVGDLIAILGEHNVGALVVSADGRTITGIVSERDVVRALVRGAEALDRPVAAIMTAQVQTASPETEVDDLIHLMTERRVRHIPVTDPVGALLGIVSIGDIVKSRLDELEGERAALVGYITQS